MNGIGIGIGLSGQYKVDLGYQDKQIRAKQQALAAQQQKASADQKRLDNIMKQTYVDDNEWKPFWKPEAQRLYAEYIDKVSKIDPKDGNPWLIAKEQEGKLRQQLNTLKVEQEAYVDYAGKDKGKFHINEDFIRYIEDGKNAGDRAGLVKYENPITGTVIDEQGNMGFSAVPRWDESELYKGIEPGHYTQVMRSGPTLDKATGKYRYKEDLALDPQFKEQRISDLESNPGYVADTQAWFSEQIRKDGGRPLPPMGDDEAMRSFTEDALAARRSVMQDRLNAMIDRDKTRFISPEETAGSGNALAKNDRNQVYTVKTPENLLAGFVNDKFPNQRGEFSDESISMVGIDFANKDMTTGSHMIYEEAGKAYETKPGSILPDFTPSHMTYGKFPVTSEAKPGSQTNKTVMAEGWVIVGKTKYYPGGWDATNRMGGGGVFGSALNRPNGALKATDREFTVVMPMFNITDDRSGGLDQMSFEKPLRRAGLDPNLVVPKMREIEARFKNTRGMGAPSGSSSQQAPGTGPKNAPAGGRAR